MIKIQESSQSIISKVDTEVKILKENSNTHEMNIATNTKQIKETVSSLEKLNTEQIKSINEKIVALCTKEDLSQFKKTCEEEVNQMCFTHPIVVQTNKCLNACVNVFTPRPYTQFVSP